MKPPYANETPKCHAHGLILDSQTMASHGLKDGKEKSLQLLEEAIPRVGSTYRRNKRRYG